MTNQLVTVADPAGLRKAIRQWSPCLWEKIDEQDRYDYATFYGEQFNIGIANTLDIMDDCLSTACLG